MGWFCFQFNAHIETMITCVVPFNAHIETMITCVVPMGNIYIELTQ